MLVSVIVPVYNTSKYLRKCIDSIVSQTYQNIEIIIVNDGSTDNSLAIIEEYSDPRINVISKINGGLSSARNTGIQLATGEYILHVDSDDYIDLDYIEKMITHAAKFKLDIVVSDYYRESFDDSSKYCVDLPVEESDILDSDKYLDMLFKEFTVVPAVWNKMFKRALYEDNKIKHPINISLGEDLFVTPILAGSSLRIGKINKAFYHYMYNPESITRQSLKNKIKEIQFVLHHLQYYFKDRDLTKFYSHHLKPRIVELSFFDILLSRYKYEITDYLYYSRNRNIKFGDYTVFVFYRLLVNAVKPFRRILK